MNKAAAEVVKNLLKEFNLSNKIITHNPLHSKCSIGLEIEVKWRDYFPELFKKYFIEGQSFTDLTPELQAKLAHECSLLEYHLLPKLESTVRAGVQRGADRYWEFAFVPATNSEFTIQQIDILKHLKLIPSQGKHSLHITVSDLKATRDVYYMLNFLEMKYADKHRIQEGFNSKNPKMSAAWAKKGYAGIFEKDSKDLAYNALEAVEFRSLYLSKDVDLTSLLKDVQFISDILYDKQHQIPNEMISSWDTCVNVVSMKLKSRGLTDTNWKKPNLDPTNWNLFIEHFDDLQIECKRVWNDFKLNTKRLQINS